MVAIVVGIANITMVITSQYLTRLNWLEVAVITLSAVGLIGYCFTAANYEFAPFLFALGATLFVAVTLWQIKKRGAESKISETALESTDG